MELRPDPGQVFESDEHRRILAALPDNAFHPELSVAEMADHSREVGQVSGDISVPTDRTFAKLITFVRRHDPYLEHLGESDIVEFLKDLEAHGYVTYTADNAWAMTQRGYDALNGPNGTRAVVPGGDPPGEPPALDGLRLKAAEAAVADNAKPPERTL
jgi:hypothetical protein